MKRQVLVIIVSFIIGLAAGIGGGYALFAPKGGGVARQLPEEIPIGGLFGLTGDLSTFSKRHLASAEMAIKDINAYVKKLGYNVKFVLVSEDTQGTQEGALSKIQALAARGVKVVLGPLSSAEVKAVKSFADSNKVVVVSHSSTSPALAIAGDFIFRFVPTDEFQGRAMAKAMWALGARKVAAIYRGDDWGDLLFEAFKENFEKMGGKVEGVRYDPKAKDLSAEVRRLSDIVKGMGASPDVMVLLIAFEDDGLAVLQAASTDPVLGTVKWFGSDGSAGSGKLLALGDFIVKIGGLPSTIFNPSLSPKYEEFTKRFKEEYGEDPEPYCYTIYDATWVVALAILEAGAYDSELIAKAIPEVAGRYFGVSGWTLLNENGDRGGGDYIIMKVVKTADGYKWVSAGIYNFASDSVTFFGEG